MPTPLETKAIDAIIDATQGDQIIWQRIDEGEWDAMWRGVALRATQLPPLLMVGPHHDVIPGYDATPLITKLTNRDDRVYKGWLRALAGGTE
jgi:hypothetical protein